MNKALMWLIVLLYLLCMAQVKADDWSLSVGGGAVVFDTPWKKMPLQYAVLPYIDAEYGRWRFGVNSGIVQYRLTPDNWQLLVSAGLDYRDEGYDNLFSFNNELSDDPVFTGYKAPDAEITARLNFNWQHFSGTVQQDISAKSEGTTASISYLYPLWHSDRGVQLRLGGGIQWLSGNYADTLYGIQPHNVNPAVGRIAYQADAASNYQAAIQLIYPFTQRWVLNAQVMLTRLDDSIRHSPLVDASSTTQFMLFISYRKF
ncbi:MAG: MipA/OmpV family protein [Gammaproteobacteria bacterium]|nr:MipA/OmpV family protein [Gammaproteobacteria bacterium]MBU1556244.1 MipA/OmpV family protein [Gammaproteobacteria bacterium]MBU2071564.1 MipA/OmpV family protein [Gammaproteobacteria bacterium]MBU2184054.1 MipA/OmpV family protein [Gammaproteobacteria bacterium]MBU2206860.1 MipA/OmpV family protein [Gammaproteobacteria bacterium]